MPIIARLSGIHNHEPFEYVEHRGYGFRALRLAAPRNNDLLPPGLEQFLEGALAGRALLDREDRAAAVVVDNRNVEPAAFLQELDVALHVGLDRGEPDQEEVGGHLRGGAAERRATRLLGLFHQHARHILNAAEREICRQVEGDLDGVARRLLYLIEIAVDEHRHRHAPFRDLDVAANGGIGLRARAGRPRLETPDRLAD